MKAAAAYMEADDLSDSTGALNKDKESPKSGNAKNVNRQNQDPGTHQNPSISIDVDNKEDVAMNFNPARSFTFTVHVSEVLECFCSFCVNIVYFWKPFPCCTHG